MSVQEMIEELPKLTPDEVRLLAEKLREVEAAMNHPAPQPWGGDLIEILGTTDDLPEDMASNHDHYLYGSPTNS